MDNATGCVGVLVVHGIGAQERGEALGKLLRGLRRVQQDFVPEQVQNGVLATIGGQPVRFYEVYWADQLKGDITFGAFQMTEFESISWFPFFNWLRGNYRRRCYSFLKIAWWCVALPIFNFFVFFAYYGAVFFAQVFTPKKAAGDSTLRHVARQVLGKRTYIDQKLDEYAGDVFSYVNSAGTAFYRDENEPPVPPQVEHCYPEIMRLFYDQLVKAASNCATIQIVAHSLGTVVTYHALSGLLFEPDDRHSAGDIREARAKIRHIYTIGSPLEKIRFFWPRLMLGGHSFGEMKTQWDNFVSWFDPLAGALRRFDDWGKVHNRRLLGGGFIRGHINYERSPVFLSTFIRGLVGHEIPFKRTFKERARDFLVLVGEALVEPVALAVLLIVGAASVALSVTIVPYVVSWLVRWWLPPQTVGRIEDIMTLTILGFMLIVMLTGPVMRAGKVHALYWAASSEAQKN